MKKTLLVIVITLLVSLPLFSQQSLDLPINSTITVVNLDHNSESNAIVVPSGKVWQLVSASSSASGTLRMNGWYVKIGANVLNGSNILGNPVFPEGTLIWGGSLATYPLLTFIEYDISNAGLAILEPNINNKIELFPNPTNSKVTLNSNKTYEIEIYNMEGQRLMKTTGNVIDMTNLSTAVYIVKVHDVIDNETSSYKVVKR